MNSGSERSYEYYKQTSARGVKWTGSAELISRLFQFAVSIVLARLLTPTDFGLIALTLVVTKFIQLVIDFGFSSALIQKPQIKKRHYNTSLSIIVLLSLFIFFILFFYSDVIARLLGNIRITELIKYISPIVVLSALNVVPRAYLTRKLSFRRIAAADFLSTLGYGLITVVSAFLLRNVWCFVIGLIAEQMILTILLWTLSGYRPKPEISVSAFRELYDFSGIVFGTRVTNFINLNALNVLINKFFGSYSLGLFSLAYQIIDLPTQRIAKNLMKVIYPILSKLQRKPQDYESITLNSIFIILLLILPFFAVLYLLSEPFVIIFFGEKWVQAVPFLKILCVAGTVRSLWTIISAVSMSLGKPQFEFYLNVTNGILLIAGIFILAPFGMSVVIWYFTLLLAGLFIFGQLKILQWLNMSILNVVFQIRVPIFANLILFFLLYILANFDVFGGIQQIIPRFILLAGLSVLIYLMSLYLLDKKSLTHLVKFVLKS